MQKAWFYRVSNRQKIRAENLLSRCDLLDRGLTASLGAPMTIQAAAPSKGTSVHTHVLYLRGERETGALGDYVKGLRESGLRNLEWHLIPNRGHYAPDEQPNDVVAILRDFIAS